MLAVIGVGTENLKKVYVRNTEEACNTYKASINSIVFMRPVITRRVILNPLCGARGL